MKLCIFLLAMLTCFVGQSNQVNKLQPDEIISRHIEAYGGAENWEKVNALELRGQFTGFSEVSDWVAIKTKDGDFFSSYNLGKNRITEGREGKNFWTIDPWQGFDFPRKINKAEQHVLMQKAEFFTPFFRWKERNFVVELKANETIDGIDMYVLSLQRPGMSAETWYISTETFLVYKSVSRWVDFAMPLIAETWYDDYRLVDGLLLPHYLEQTFSTRHTITEIKEVIVNPEFDKVVFAMPSCPQMKKISFLNGTWDVKVEYMNRLGNWQVFDTVESVFEHSANNIILGNISYEVNFPYSFSYTIHYNRKTEQYQMVVYNEFYSTTNLYSGKFEDGLLVFSNKPENSTNEQSGDASPIQYVFTITNENDFVMERKQFADNAWSGVERLSYIRK